MPKPSDVSVAPGELKGVAFQVKSTPTSPAVVVQPANDQIKHSLFCEPTSARSNQGGPRRHFRARRRSSASSVYSTNPPTEHESPLATVEDELSPLPENTHFGANIPRKGSLQRPKLPQNISMEAQASTDTLVSPGGDRLSPLPTRQLFGITTPRSPEYPPPQSLRAGSPTPHRSNSTGSSAPPYSPGNYGAAKSIFPQYDPSRPLQQQEYYPTARSPTPTLPSEKISKAGSPPDKRVAIERMDSGVALIDGYEHISAANDNDLLEIFNASCGHFPVAGRRVGLALLQPRSQGTSLGIGTLRGEVLYSMEKDMLPPSSKESQPSKGLVIKKHAPQDQSSSQVAQLALPDADKSSNEREKDVVSIFPQMAAIKAIATISNSPVAAEIATFDPAAKSPEAVRLAQDAVSEAHHKHRCELVRATRKRDSLGAVTATYNLQHPSLGAFPVTVTRSTVGRHSRDPRAKISLHHPSATPAAVAAETLVLAFLDFARDACVLDTPGLLALEGPYIIDTVICALLAVAVIENDALMAETLTFDAPPKSPLPPPKRNSLAKHSRQSMLGEPKRSSSFFRRNKKEVRETTEPEQVELPVLTKGALAILGLSFKTAVWILGTGVKMTAGAVIGISHLAQKA